MPSLQQLPEGTRRTWGHERLERSVPVTAGSLPYGRRFATDELQDQRLPTFSLPSLHLVRNLMSHLEPPISYGKVLSVALNQWAAV